MKVKVSLLILGVVCLLAACSHDDDVPSISQENISMTQLQGGWGVTSTSLLWDLTTRGNTLESLYNFKSKVKDKLFSESEYVSIFFMNDTAFYVRHNPNNEGETENPYIKMSTYTMTNGTYGNAVYFKDSTFLGFYAPHFYVKHSSSDSTALIFYLRKGEIMDMLEEDGSLSSFYISTIKSCVNSVEADIVLHHDSLAVYSSLLSQYGHTVN